MIRIIAVLVLLCIGVSAQDEALSDDSTTAAVPAVSSVPDSIEKKVDTLMAEPVIEKKKGTKQSGADPQLQSIRPLTFDSSGIGALRINVYPEDADVYINTVFVGNGNQVVKNLKSGIYSVRLETKTSLAEDYVLVKNGEIFQLNRNVERPTRFVVETSWAFFFDKNGGSIGPSVDLGIQYKNHYFGIDYTWGVIDEAYLLGGAGFKYHYRFNFKDIVSIAPGFMGGFWYSDYNGFYSYSYDNHYDDYESRLYFGGIGCKFNFGYKWVFFNIESSALFGTSVSCLLKAGASFKL